MMNRSITNSSMGETELTLKPMYGFSSFGIVNIRLGAWQISPVGFFSFAKYFKRIGILLSFTKSIIKPCPPGIIKPIYSDFFSRAFSSVIGLLNRLSVLVNDIASFFTFKLFFQYLS